MIADDAVGGAALDHVVGDVPADGVDEPGLNVPRPVQLRYRTKPALVQEPLNQRPVDLLANAAVIDGLNGGLSCFFSHPSLGTLSASRSSIGGD